MTNKIREATIDDSRQIRELISQLGYSHSLEFIETKLLKLLDSNNDIVIVYETNSDVLGLITLHTSIQLAFEGDFMSIGYLAVDESSRSLGIGRKLEECATKIAKEKNYSLIEVFSQKKRVDAHRFYERQGYEIAEVLFSKTINH